LAFERSQYPADVSRIEAEPPAQISHVGPNGSNLPEQPRLTERARSSEKMILERANSLGDDAVEAPDLIDSWVRHDL
jgi:hypothetical protein